MAAPRRTWNTQRPVSRSMVGVIARSVPSARSRGWRASATLDAKGAEPTGVDGTRWQATCVYAAALRRGTRRTSRVEIQDVRSLGQRLERQPRVVWIEHAIDHGPAGLHQARHLCGRDAPALHRRTKIVRDDLLSREESHLMQLAELLEERVERGAFSSIWILHLPSSIPR